MRENAKFQGSIKFQYSEPVGDGLECGDWNFLGVWGLELGILKI
jgi:hypothetical protein